MASSAPPNLDLAEPDSSEVFSPETAKSGVRPTEDFVKAVAERMTPVRIEVARTLGRSIRPEPDNEVIFDDSEDAGVPSDAVLEKLARSKGPEDFIEIIDLMFAEDDKKKKGHRRGV